MNQAKIVKLRAPADTIVIGNPEIADASVQDASTVVLTGKGFGVTNLVILDEDGSPIIDEQVTVVRQTASLGAHLPARRQCRPCPARPIARAPTRATPSGPPKPEMSTSQ